MKSDILNILILDFRRDAVSFMLVEMIKISRSAIELIAVSIVIVTMPLCCKYQSDNGGVEMWRHKFSSQVSMLKGKSTTSESHAIYNSRVVISQ